LLVYDYTTNQYAVEKAGNDEFVDFGKIEACQNLDSKINLLLADNPIELYQPSYVRKSIYDPDGQAQEQFGIIPLANQTDMPDAWITMFGEIQASAIYTDNVRINISNNRISGEEIWDLYEGTVTIDEVSDGYIIGSVDGVIYPVERATSGDVLYIKTGPAVSLTGTFQSLIVK